MGKFCRANAPLERLLCYCNLIHTDILFMCIVELRQIFRSGNTKIKSFHPLPLYQLHRIDLSNCCDPHFDLL